MKQTMLKSEVADQPVIRLGSARARRHHHVIATCHVTQSISIDVTSSRLEEFWISVGGTTLRQRPSPENAWL